MTGSMSVRQYEASLPTVLSSPQLDAVLTAHRTHLDVLPTSGGAFVLKGNRWVGAIRLPDLDVLVSPKVGNLATFWMLARANRISGLATPDVRLTAESGVLDALAHVFAREVRSLIHRGLYREYVEREEQLPYVRARLLISESITAGRGLAHRPVSRFAELTTNTPINQALRAATESLLRFSFVTPGLDDRLRWNVIHLAEADSRSFHPRQVHALPTNRLNQHYRPALVLAAMVLSGMTFEFASGDTLAPGFLVNMDAVYQDYLTALLAEEAAAFGLHLRRPGSLYLDKDRTVVVNPDIVLADQTGRVAAAFDAKYKLVDADADVYQALAYTKALNLGRVLLVYPEEGEATATDIRVRNDTAEVLVRTVPVGRRELDFTDLERRAACAARRLIREALGQAAPAAAA